MKWYASIKTFFAFIVFIEILSVGLFVFFTQKNTRLQNSLNQFQRERHEMIQVADRLRQSSDDLTRMARTYVITGEERYRQNFYRILAIRNGTAPRPFGYGGIYWDYLYPPRHHVEGEKASLQSIIDKLPFTREEVAEIERSHRQSDALVALEEEAFHAMTGRFKDGQGAYTRHAEPDQPLAVRLLHGIEYHRAKEQIMAPLDRFMQLLHDRTAKTVARYETGIRENSNALWALIGFFVAGNLLLLSHLNARIVRPMLRVGEQIRTEPGRTLTQPGRIKDELYMLISRYNEGWSRLTTIGQIRERFIGQPVPARMYDALREDLLELSGSTVGFVAEAVEKGEDGYGLKLYSAEPVFPAEAVEKTGSGEEEGYEVLNPEEPVGQPVRQREAVIVDNLGRKLFRGEGRVEAYLGLPVFYGRKLVGEVGLANRPGGYDEEVVASLQPVLAAIGQIIVARREREGRKKAERDLAEMNQNLQERVETEIAKRRNQQQILIQQSKMAAMGEMIGAITHQWKQPLNAIGLMTQDLSDAYEYGELGEESVRTYERNVMEQVNFMAQTINDFKAFFKPSKEKTPFLACEAVRKVYDLVKARFVKMEIDVAFHEHEHFTVDGYPNEFMQVVLNLFGNARDAIEEKGEKGRIDVRFENDETHGTIYIRDNGGGVPEELLPDKVFQPYVSTKGEKGTGIGLQIAKLIIEENMEGAITVHNTAEGAEFVIRLPLAKASNMHS